MKRNYLITVFLLSFFIEVNAQHDIFIKQVELPSVHIIKIIGRSKAAGVKSGFSKAKAAAKMTKASAMTRTNKDSLNAGNDTGLPQNLIFAESNPLYHQFSKSGNSVFLLQSGCRISIIERETELDQLLKNIHQVGLSNNLILLIPVNALDNFSVSQSGSNNTAIIAQNAVNSNAVTIFQRRGFNNITIGQGMSSGPPCNSVLSQ